MKLYDHGGVYDTRVINLEFCSVYTRLYTYMYVTVCISVQQNQIVDGPWLWCRAAKIGSIGYE